ncbi:hypothetical protein VPH35_010861 [Triticum aestivum]|uniref:uncharacterized protein isoform X2 n=1 Tax=Triticum aestivum TaxID=4565 RepID=UPI001D0347CB|nr:uncharacterized protein LOC123097605 isoform X2 [Triticum aestivum]
MTRATLLPLREHEPCMRIRGGLSQATAARGIKVLISPAAAAATITAGASVPLLFPVRRPRRRQEEWGPVRLVLFFLGFCFSGGIDEVVATMACWNKVSPVSPYLDDFRFGAGEGPVRVCVPRSVGSLQILAVGVSFKEYFWLAFGVATSTSSSVLFCGLTRFLQPSDLVVVDCKLVLLGVMLQPMLLQRLLDLVSRGEWLLRSSKPCVARAFADLRCPLGQLELGEGTGLVYVGTKRSDGQDITISSANMGI